MRLSCSWWFRSCLPSRLSGCRGGGGVCWPYRNRPHCQVVILYSFLGNPVTSGTLVYTAVWQGLGKAKMPFYATTIGMWIIRIFSGYFLGVSLGMGLAGVWIATVVDNVWRAIFLYVMYRRYLVKRKF